MNETTSLPRTCSTPKKRKCSIFIKSAAKPQYLVGLQPNSYCLATMQRKMVVTIF